MGFRSGISTWPNLTIGFSASASDERWTISEVSSAGEGIDQPNKTLCAANPLVTELHTAISVSGI